MKLEELGYNNFFEIYRNNNNLDSFDIGRIIAEHKEQYFVKNGEGEYEAEIIGKLRFTATNRSDFPAVGDWVAISIYDENKALIHAIYSRKTIIERRTVGKIGEKQIIASNVDFAFIVQAVDRDFNINRIERYLAICNSSNVGPLIIITKIDLISISQLNNILSKIKERIKNVPVIAINNESKEGYENLNKIIQKSKTYCLMGSSGVGKSTLLNNLSGHSHMKTGSIGSTHHRGKHITSHRELVVLENGAILIDNPGMREVGITDDSSGLEITFEAIENLSLKCKFGDCSHTVETGCAIIEAIANKEISKDSYNNFLKMRREKEHFECSIAEKRKKDKDFGKMVKNVVHHKNKRRNELV